MEASNTTWRAASKEARLYLTIRSRLTALQWERQRNPNATKTMVIDSDIRGIAPLVDQLRAGLNNGSYNKTQEAWNRRWPKTNKEHLEQVQRRAGLEPEVKRPAVLYGILRGVVSRYKEKSVRARKHQIATRLTWEMTSRPEAYVVFNTLTVDGKSERLVFGKQSYAWQSYLAKVHWLVYGTAKRPKESSYAAVVERGEKTGRLHIHVMHVMSKCPGEDPNKGATTPKRREIQEWKKCWEYGWSAPIAVRTGPTDAYAQAGWRWPAIKQGKRWVPVEGSVGKVANYLAKYVGKTYNAAHTKGSIHPWRTRISRNLGTKRVAEKVASLPLETLEEVVERHVPTIKMMGRGVPSQMWRTAAAKEILRRKPRSSWKAMYLEPAPSLTDRIRRLLSRTTRTSSPEITGSTNSDLSESTMEALREPPGRLPGIETGSLRRTV